LVPDSGNPTIYLLLNGKKVAKPFIEDNRLKFEILDNKEILDQVLPDFDTSTIKPTKLKLSDVMKVADSVSSKNLRLYHPPYVFDVFQKDGKKAILVNGLKSAISDSLDITNPLTLDNEVVSAVEVPFLAERLNVEELLNLLYRTIIFEFQSLVFYGSNIGVVSGVLANEVNSIVSGAFHQTTSSIQDLHNRVLMLGGIPSKYSNPATWSAFTGVAQVVSEIPFDIQSVISHALSLEMVTIASYNQLHDFTKDADPVTNKIVTMFLEQHQVTVQSLQKILTDSKLT
jgi:ferritin-like protein